MVLSAAATRYPSDGAGGATATATSSELASSPHCTIYGFTVHTVGATDVTVTFVNPAGSALANTGTYLIKTTYVAPGFIPIGGPNGLGINVAGGFGVTIDVACSITVYYDRVD